MKAHSKIAIIGSGFVGAATAYSIAMKGIVSEIVLIDANGDKAVGEALDISHGLSFIGELSVRAGGYEDVKDCDIIIVTAGANRKPGETRMDLANKNVGIAKSITKSIMEYYTGGVILVVANPVDIITYVIQKESGLPAGRVFGTGTALDSARFRYILSECFNVDVRNIHGFIMGEHGETQFPVWSSVRLVGMDLDTMCKNLGVTIDKDEVEEAVRAAGAEVIRRKGATYYAIASVVTRICEAVVKNQNSIHNASVVLHGQYGLDNVSLSIPCVVGLTGVQKIIEADFTPDEVAKLNESANHIRSILSEVGY